MAERDQFIADERFQVVTLRRATAREDTIGLEWQGGGVGVPNVPSERKPREGDRVRIFSTHPGPGGVVHGLDIYEDGGWRPYFYRTEAEREQRRRDQLWRRECEKALEFAERVEDMDRSFESLPEIFQRRILRFRRNNPRFRIEFERYELNCCEEAVLLSEWAKDKDPLNPLPVIERLWEMDHEEQAKAYPPLEESGHSGNSWGWSLKLAHHYLRDVRLVEYEHGALSPLVGCEDYGCPPPTQEEWRSEPVDLGDLDG